MRILYVTTTFPVYSETFLQREARALRAAGAELHIVSLHGGEAEWEGLPVARFRKRRLWGLVWRLPVETLSRAGEMGRVMRLLNREQPRGWLNFWENLLGMGAAVVMARELRREGYDLAHCVWAGAPAAFGLAMEALTGLRFSMGAHAYDVFEHGGDWLLEAKARRAALVHCSTEAAARRMRSKAGPGAGKVVRLLRGMDALPVMKALREDRSVLRLLCVARLVEKKGLFLQLEIYRRLLAAGVAFEARIVGDGPLEGGLREEIGRLGLEGTVRLLGRLSQEEVGRELGWADALLHTGVVARSGDRDGLPNVIPEAMAAGAIVLASPMAGVREAVTDGVTGLLLDPREPERWVTAARGLREGGAQWEAMQAAARAWVERNFVASRNSAALIGLMQRAVIVEKSPALA